MEIKRNNNFKNLEKIGKRKKRGKNFKKIENGEKN